MILTFGILTVACIVSSIKFTFSLHVLGILSYLNFLLLYISAIQDNKTHFIVAASEKTVFSVYCIVLYVLDTKWIIQMPCMLTLQFFANFYFNSFARLELENHGGIELISIFQISLFTFFIAVLSYFLRKA